MLEKVAETCREKKYWLKLLSGLKGRILERADDYIIIGSMKGVLLNFRIWADIMLIKERKGEK